MANAPALEYTRAMPYYVISSHIDWHYAEARPDLQAIMPRANVELLSRDHTADTFEKELRSLAAQHPGLVVDALVEDGFRAYWLYRARDGKVLALEVDERPASEPTVHVDLPLDELATVRLARNVDEVRALLAAQRSEEGDEEDGELTLPTRYDDEASMREVLTRIAQSIDDGEERFVAEVDYERFLVELRPGRANVQKLTVGTEPALFEHLQRERYGHVPEPDREPDEMREQSLYWPKDMMQLVTRQAARLDTSVSHVVQTAWTLARSKLATRNDHEDLSGLLDAFSSEPADKERRTLFFSERMLTDIQHEAARVDASLSFVVQCAWVLAQEEITKLPPG